MSNSKLRDGDRLWWQNQGFDDATIKMIQKSTLGAIEVRNNDTTVIQHDVFLAAERHASNVAPADPDGRQLVIGIDADNAVIAGGPADDTIVAGLGRYQTLTGGGGGDVFILSATGVHDDHRLLACRRHTAIRHVGRRSDLIVLLVGHYVTRIPFDDLLGVAPHQLSQANFDLPAGSNTRSHDRESHFGGDSGHHRMLDH